MRLNLLDYTITVTNHGPVEATGVIVHDPIGQSPVKVSFLPGGSSRTRPRSDRRRPARSF